MTPLNCVGLIPWGACKGPAEVAQPNEQTRDWDGDERATFLHPDGREERTPRGRADASSTSCAYVSARHAPDWLRDDGVEVVVAAGDGSVAASFEVSSVDRDRDAYVLRA